MPTTIIPTPLSTILSWYQTGDFPTQAQFEASWVSFYHKEELIPLDKIENLTARLQDKTDKSVYEAHLTNVDAHITTLAKIDASNLNANNIEAWKTILEVGSLPANMATVDDLPNNTYGNVWSKQQSDALYMIADEFVSNGKIMASKIEALGLTELIEVSDATLGDFVTFSSDEYAFEKNDIIAIPENAPNYSLYIYKGGDKTVENNYLPTGLTNITMGMVQGLQASLDNKLNKPVMTVNYVGRWNGNNFVDALIFDNGASVRIGNSAPAPGSVFDVQSTGRASLPAPRMTQTQRLSIVLSSLAAGGLIYQTDGQAGYYLWDGTTWKALGTNISNADLTNTAARTFTQNAAFTWDTLGNPYYWKGLADKTNDPVNFSKVLKINPTTKEIAHGDALTVNMGTGTLTVNHIYPNPIPSPTYSADLQNFITNVLPALNYTTLPAGNWKIKTLDDIYTNNKTVGNAVLLNSFDHANSYTGGRLLSTAATPNMFPFNKKWVIKIGLSFSNYGWVYGNNPFARFGMSIDSSVTPELIPSIDVVAEILGRSSPQGLFLNLPGATPVTYLESGADVNQIQASLLIMNVDGIIYYILNYRNSAIILGTNMQTNMSHYKFVINNYKHYSDGNSQSIINTSPLTYWIEP